MINRPLIKLWIAVFLTFLGVSQAWAWPDTNWPYRSHVVVSNNSNANATNRVFEINLSTADFHPDYSLSAAGNDIRVYDTDDTSQLDFYIEHWDVSAGNVRIFVKTTLAANSSKTIYIYYGLASAPAETDIVSILSQTGLRFHTRRYVAGTIPSDLASAESIFSGLGDGDANYGCTIVNNFTNINNSGLFGSSYDIFFKAEHWFETTTTQNWEFEFGGDYGHGGGIYLDDIPRDERWGDNLWWAANWNNSTVMKTGVMSLAPGWHTLKFFGIEDGADGPTSVRYRINGGTWRAWRTSNYDIRSPNCATDTYPTIVQPPLLQTSSKVGVDVNGNNLLANETISYTITLTESNGQEAERVSISDNMSAQNISSIENVIVPAGATPVVTGAVLNVTNITVPANGAAVVTFDAIVADGTSSGTVITNTANYNSAGGNQAFAKATLISNSLTVAPTAEVELRINANQTIATPGQQVRYTINATNLSAFLAYDVVIGSHIGVFTALRLAFNNSITIPFRCAIGCPDSGLDFTPADIEYDDGSGSWTYTLSSGAGGAPAGYDAIVKRWRINMNGIMNDNSSADNRVRMQYKLIVL